MGGKMIVRGIQEELQQSKPFSSPRQTVMISLLKTADVIRRQLGEFMDQYGITPQQYNVLRILRGTGTAGLPTLSIGQRLIEATPGITRLLDRMESRGWVERVRCAKDRRVVYARILQPGLDLLDRIDPELTAMHAECFPLLDDSELEQLIALLDKARAVCKEEPGSGDGNGAKDEENQPTAKVG